MLEFAAHKLKDDMSTDRIMPTHARSCLTKFKQALRTDWAARRFSLLYQPQVDLRLKKIVRFEALMRWERAAQTPVSPQTFVAVAEEIGMIGEMSRWVMETACAEAARWPAEIGVSVNISPISLRDPELPEMVHEALARTQVAANRLELEITETAAIVMDQLCLRGLEIIRGMGVRITIDDLDAGHSSLRYLLDFPFDKIKMDGIYATALTGTNRRGNTAREIIRAIGALCKALHIDALAEGVETPEQLAQVVAANFTEVQGHVFAEAVPPKKIAGLLLRTDMIRNRLDLPCHRAATTSTLQ